MSKNIMICSEGSDDAVRTFLTADRWSEIRRCLENSTDALWDPSAITTIDTFAERDDDPSVRTAIEQRKQLLLAAHRFGLLGAYAHVQGHGQRFIIEVATCQELQHALSDPPVLQDLFDRHPELIRVYQKLIGDDLSFPWPLPNVPTDVETVIQRMMAMTNEKSFSKVIQTLAPLHSKISARLYPELYGNLRLRLARARAAIAKTNESFAEALADFDAARSIFTAERFPVDCAQTNFYLGSALMERGHAKDAIEVLGSAVELLEPSALEDRLLIAVAPRSEADMLSLRAQTNLLLAQALWWGERWKEALERAQGIEQEKDSDPSTAARACLLLSDFEMERQGVDLDRRVQAAEHACRRGLDYIVEAAHDPEVYGRLQMRLAQLLLRPEGYGFTERLHRAEHHIALALESLDDKLVPDAFAHARLIQHEFLTLSKPPGWQPDARECAQDALRIAQSREDRELEADALEALADVSDGYDDKVRLYGRAETALVGTKLYDSRARILRLIGNLHFDAKKWALALHALKQAIAEAPLPKGHPMDALQHSAKTSAVFPQAAYAAAKLERFEEAFTLLEGGKARFLKLFTGLSLWSPSELESLLALVPKNGALVMPVVSSHGTITFVVPDSARNVTAEHIVESALDTKASGEFIARWLQPYFDFVRTTDVDAWERGIDQVCPLLWDKLMMDVYDRLTALGIARRSTVLLVPPNFLAPLPFHAARNREGRYPFTEDYLTVYSPSLALLHPASKKAPSKQPANENVLALLDPRGDLPFSTYELEALKRFIPVNRLDSFTGDDVTTDIFFEHASGAKYLHFACHGFNDWRDPLGTGLELHDAGIGALSFLQPDINLKATELVTLSACETGITTAFRRVFGNTVTTGGEEYVGLPAALLAAGVKYVLSTLWPVEDYAAALFIEEFYRLLLKDGEACHVAMNGARDHLRKFTARDMIEDIKNRLGRPGVSKTLFQSLTNIRTIIEAKYASEDRLLDHPNYWAAYVLNGCPPR